MPAVYTPRRKPHRYGQLVDDADGALGVLKAPVRARRHSPGRAVQLGRAGGSILKRPERQAKGGRSERDEKLRVQWGDERRAGLPARRRRSDQARDDP